MVPICNTIITKKNENQRTKKKINKIKTIMNIKWTMCVLDAVLCLLDEIRREENIIFIIVVVVIMCIRTHYTTLVCIEIHWAGLYISNRWFGVVCRYCFRHFFSFLFWKCMWISFSFFLLLFCLNEKNTFCCRWLCVCERLYASKCVECCVPLLCVRSVLGYVYYGC